MADMTRQTPWYETFFTGIYAEVLGGDPHTARAVEQARLVKRLLHVRRGGRVLDVPCGQGRLTIPLAQAGLRMTGVDLTARYIRRAKRLARAAGVDARFLCRDMREIDFDAEFHAAFNWFTSIGYFSEADDLAFCRRLHRALRPAGRLLIECANISFILSHFRGGDERTIGKVRITSRNRWNARTRRMRSVWTLRKGDVVETHPIDLRCYTGTEMRKLLGAAGFRDVELHGNPPLGRFTRHSRRLIAVATRPKS